MGLTAARRLRAFRFSGLVVAALAASATALDGSAGRAASRTLYVSILDSQHVPITGLGPSDFTVTIDGQPQEILSAGTPRDPLSIALLTDRLGLNSFYTQYEISQTLRAFVTTIRAAGADHRFSLATFDGPVLQLTTFTSAPGELDRSISRLSSSIPEARLLDAIMAACRSMRTAPSPRHVIVAFVAAYRTETSAARPDEVAEQLRLSGAPLFAVEVRTSGGNYANATRELVLDQGTALSGGWLESVGSRVALGTAATSIARALLADYELVIAPGTGTARSRVTVSVARPGAKVFAPRWIGE